MKRSKMEDEIGRRKHMRTKSEGTCGGGGIKG